MNKKILSRICAFLLALIMLLPVVGCSAARSVRASSNASRVVATAGDVEILYDEYYYLAMTRLAQLKLEYGEDAMSNPEAVEKLRKFMAENLLTESHALLAIGMSLGIDVTKGDIADNVDEHMDGILEETFGGDRDAYIQSLREGFLTDRYIRTFVAVENYLSIEIILALLENGTLDDSDETAMAYLRGDGFTRVHQVVIKEIVTGNGTVILSMEGALAKAQALRDTVASATTDAARDKAMFEAMSESHDFSDTGSGLYFARRDGKGV